MRILHVLQAVSRNFGGPQTVLRGILKAQVRAGHNVDVASTNVDAPTGVLKVPPNCFVEQDGARVRHSSVEFRPLLVSRDLKSFLDCHIEDYDVLHIHGLYRFPPTYAAWLARKRGVPYVIRPHGSLDPYLFDKSSKSVLLKRMYERLFDFPNLHAASAIHYTAEEERQRTAFLKLRAPTFVVPNGLDWAPFEHLPKRGRLRASWGVGDAPTILFLGRIHFKKGLDLLIPAFAKLRSSIPNAQLVIAGPEHDGYGDEVRGWVTSRGLNDCIKFVGALHGDDVIQAYVDSDVFALPSYTENFGMTVVEAMACGLPVVISDQVNIHAEVLEANAGVVVRCNAQELAEAMTMLASDGDLRANLGESGRTFVQNTFVWPRIIDRLTEEYSNAILNNRGRPSGNGSLKAAT